MMSPEEVLESLKASSPPRVHKTLDAVYLACKEQKERKSTDFSYAMIAKVGKVYGVPAKQSLHNEGGARYRTLIDAFAAEVPPKPKPVSGKYAWIEGLPIGEQKLLTKMLLAELKAAEFKLREILPPNKIVSLDTRQQPSELFKLLPGERRALEYLVSSDFLSERSLTLGSRGDAYGPNGEQLFRPGTFNALKKALEHL
ncbi:gamma-mobile-trio protein GmtX [Pseudomonas amygdali]|uniref:gamma-mobile-trio protein GmtX n=1 Tax=Pseudomonas amygdali TaxID=47877 RepID=UPI000E3E5EC3|nr:gamma-mobile-trio protein GmtX [Pseudomonas amygdali]